MDYISKKRNRGYTLIEILIVLVILLGIVMMLGRTISGAKDAAKHNQAMVDMNGAVKTALMLQFSKQQNTSPGSDAATIIRGWGTGKDLSTVIPGINIKDPWGKQYKITGTATEVTVRTANYVKAGDPEIKIPLADFQ
ncbi:MAG: type II secretion system GspH family protein [Puniceicoccales bacterium]|jgi:prepilin-type N-terminal cleavage/methylation domain-containing protein|nr:type II secretion system GspH family protein [Puniceicoccales bacterium]